jgi:uncharacterized protein
MSDAESRRTVRWQRLDRPGIERATLWSSKGRWNLDARIETDLAGGHSRIRYRVICDSTWRTQAAWATIKEAGTRRRLGLFVTADGGWILNGQEQADLRGCVDIDFEISPATNTLPIRRLDPKMGEARDIRVAWVRFPELRMEPTRQRYTRVAERRYRFENLDSGHSVEILVDDAGLVLEYPDLWARAPNP